MPQVTQCRNVPTGKGMGEPRARLLESVTMATYAIGDIQGCHASLLGLLDQLPFQPGRDRLVLVGDLVNRGPRSLETLRWARSAGPAVEMVLGNHDLHLLAVAAGRRTLRGKDTLDHLLGAPDRKDLLAWLASRPFLLHHDPYLFVHAGLHPAWTLETALALGGLLTERLQTDPGSLYDLMRSDDIPAWDPARPIADQLVTALAVFTRMRTLRADGTFCAGFTGPPKTPRPAAHPGTGSPPSGLPAAGWCLVTGPRWERGK